MQGFVTRVRMPVSEEAQKAAFAAVLPDVKRLFLDLEASVADKMPTELTCGMIAGYLRGRGYSWQEAFVAMDDYLQRATPSAAAYPPRHTFKAEMITCSVGLAKYLPDCLRRNMVHFDRTIVVTDRHDTASQEVARAHGADVFVTDWFYVEGRRFDRGTAYNRALKLLTHRDWVTFMDVDIVLPVDHRARLEAFGLRDNVFYGMDRLNLNTPETRAAFLSTGDASGAVSDSTTEWGFGYHQLVNLSNPFLKRLPEGKPIYPSSPDVFQSDYLFRHQFGSGHTMTPEGVWTWDPLHQQKLPWVCYHLGSNGCGQPPNTLAYLAPSS